ncbi:MAG TPA: hypothetical protein DDZ51_03965 [Planctomycetaceae bacterium]|nr:hypothetical protein [Planctomycetaceae bacterium]
MDLDATGQSPTELVATTGLLMNKRIEMPAEEPSPAVATQTEIAIPGSRLRVQMIGDPGVGKTSFLGALGLIAQSSQNRFIITPIGSETKRRVDDLRTMFGKGIWPTKTFHGQSFTFQLHRRHQTVTIEIDDIPGESFVTAMRRGNENADAARTTELIRQTDLLLLMVDGGKLDSDEALPGTDLIQAVTEKRLAIGHSLPHVAVVVTKADLCRKHPVRSSAQAKKRVTRRMSKLADTLHNHVDQTHWFALSVCGFDKPCVTANVSDADSKTSDQNSNLINAFSPAGFDSLLDLFLTLAYQPQRNYRRTRIAFFVAAVFMIVAAFKYGDYEVQQQRRQVEDPQRRVQELPAEVATENEPIYRGRVLELIRAVSDDLDRATAVREVDDILMRVDDLPTLAQRLTADELAALDKQAQQRKEVLLYERVSDAAQSGDAVRIGIAVDQYLMLFPSGPHAQQARALLSKQEDKRRNRAREEIKSVIVRDAATLERKLELISNFLDQFDALISPVESEQIRLAMETSRIMLRPSRYDVTLVRTAGLDRPRAHGVVVSLNGAEIAQFDDSGTVSEKIWNRTFNLRWQIGSRIEITLQNYRYRNNTIAYFDAAGPLAILALASKNLPTRIGEDYLSDPPAVTVTFKCDQLPDATVTAIEQWIFPGEAW